MLVTWLYSRKQKQFSVLLKPTFVQASAKAEWADITSRENGLFLSNAAHFKQSRKN